MNKCLWQVFTKFSLQEVEVFNNKCTLMSVLGFDVTYQWSLKTLLVYIFPYLGKYSKWGCSMNKPQNLQESSSANNNDLLFEWWWMWCIHRRPLFNQNHDKAKQDHSTKSLPWYYISDQNNVSTIIVTKPSKTIAPSPFHDMTLVIKAMCQQLLWL